MRRNQNALSSFCRKSYRDVGPLVEGPGDVYICGECAELCQSIVKQERRRRGQHDFPAPSVGTPEEIRAELDRLISGQQGAKEALALAAHRHYASRGEEKSDSGAVLLVGPSRGSRLLLARA